MKGKEGVLMPTPYKRAEKDQERGKREQKSESLQKSISLRSVERELALAQRRASVPKEAESALHRQRAAKEKEAGAGAGDGGASAIAARRRASMGAGSIPGPGAGSGSRETMRSQVRGGSTVPDLSRDAWKYGREIGRLRSSGSSSSSSSQGFASSAKRRSGSQPHSSATIPERRPEEYAIRAALEAQGVAGSFGTMPASNSQFGVGFMEEGGARSVSPGRARLRKSESSSSDSDGLGDIERDAEGWQQGRSAGNSYDLAMANSGGCFSGEGSPSGKRSPQKVVPHGVEDMRLRDPVRGDEEEGRDNAMASTSGSRSNHGEQRQSMLELGALKTRGKGMAGLVGLSNEGNTCYLNSCLQCLAHTLPLASVVLKGFSDLGQSPSNRSSIGGASRRASCGSTECAEELAHAFRQLMTDLWNKAEYSELRPTNFIRRLTALAPQFAGNHQHDAQEVMRTILDGLHDAVNRVRRPAPYRELNVDEMPQAEAAEVAWKNHKSLQDSVIQDIFCGQLQSTIECSVCHHKSHCFDPFMDLSLPLPKRDTRPYQARSREVTIQDCLAAFVAPERLDGTNKWFCSSCKTSQAATKQLNIYRLPPVLVFHFKRFCKGSSYSFTKDETTVSYPIKGLDLTESLGDRSGMWSSKQAIYDLYGVCNHSGTLSGGHYTALCKNVDNDSWHHFNDSFVSSVQEPAVQSSSAYILFYQQREPRSSS